MRNIDAEQAYVKRLQAVGQLVEAVDRGQVCKGLPGGVVTGFNVRTPSEERPEVLVVVKASVDGDRFVAFVGALDVGTALLTWATRERSKGLKWRPDVPWSPPPAGGGGG